MTVTLGYRKLPRSLSTFSFEWGVPFGSLLDADVAGQTAAADLESFVVKGDFEAHEPLLFQPCQIPGSASTAPKSKNSLRDVNRTSSARASTDF